jgi:hypothetical protein
MNLSTLKNRKSLKIITLLVSALLISTASATVYSYLYQNATVSVLPGLKWGQGVDYAAAGATITGATCDITGMEGQAGSTTIYNPVTIVNTDDTNAISFDLKITTAPAGETDSLDTLVVKLYEGATLKGTLTIWSSGAQGSDLTGLSIPLSTTWTVQWEITWKDTAASSDTVTVGLTIQATIPP